MVALPAVLSRDVIASNSLSLSYQVRTPPTQGKHPLPCVVLQQCILTHTYVSSRREHPFRLLPSCALLQSSVDGAGGGSLPGQPCVHVPLAGAVRHQQAEGEDEDHAHHQRRGRGVFDASVVSVNCCVLSLGVKRLCVVHRLRSEGASCKSTCFFFAAFFCLQLVQC